MSSNGGSMIICKKCGTENKNGDSFCKGCGDNLLQQNIDEALPLPQDEPIVFCQKCGTKSQSGDSFCKGCGGSLLEVANAGNVSKENANKKVWLSIIAVVVGILLIAIALKISNNNDYTTEAASAATEEVMPAAEVSYREAIPITTNNYYELQRRANEAGNNLVSSASEVDRMKATLRDPIETMGYDFDASLLTNIDIVDEASMGFRMIFGMAKATINRYPDESVAKGLVSEETKNTIVGARDAALQKSKEPIGKYVFIDANNNLMWQDNVEAKTVHKDWQGAISYCENLSLDGFDDWRLPKIEELESITDDTRYNTAIKEGFENVVNSNYWSSSTDFGNSDNGWNVDFGDGSGNTGNKTGSYYVRCVRTK